MDNNTEFIKSVYYFNSLSDDNIHKILNVCKVKSFSRGEIIFEEGSPGDAFHIITKGTVEIWKNYNKKEMNLVAIQGPGSFFGEMALIDSLPRSATVKANDNVHTLSILQDDFIQIIKENSSIALAVMRSMSSMIRSSTEKLFTNLNIKSKMLLYETEVRKQSESALKESEEKFRILAENVTDILWIIDNNMDHFTYVSPAIEKILGYTSDDFIKMSWFEFMSPSSVNNSKRIFNDLSKSKEDKNYKSLHTLEIEVKHSNGTLIWLETSFHFLRDNEGKIINTLGVSRDITRRKIMEKTLADTQALFLAALDQSSAGVILSDSSGKYVQLVNAEAEKVLGMTKEEIINTPLDQLASDKIMYADGTRYKNNGLPITRAVTKGEVINEEVIIHLPGQKKRWLLINAAPIKNDAGEIIAGIAVFPDITKNKELEDKTREFGIKFQQARKMESIATLAGGIAHEFNNALFEITGNIELLQMSMDNRNLLENYSQKIKNSAFRMANLTKKLIAYSRGGKYQPVLTHLSDIIKKSIPDSNHSMNPNIDIVIDAMTDSYKIEADLTQLKMAISSILTNAIESIETSGLIKIKTYTMDVNETFSRQHPGLKPGRYSCLTIEDNGRGMPVQTISKIFEPFFTTNFIGRGLGMAAVYGIVKNHNGWIGVNSKLGKGTTVNVYIPIYEKKQLVEIEKTRTSSLVRNSVLIVEDKTAVLAVNREMFEYLGYNTIGAKSGTEAINIINNSIKEISIAVLDFDLPDIKCEHLIEGIKKLRPDINILISTGYPADEVSRTLNIDQNKIIIKPYSLSTLSLKLKESLDPPFYKHINDSTHEEKSKTHSIKID
jgi:PAS domain S-box-containing protein